MNVDNATRERFQHWRFQYSHKAGEDDQFHTRLLQYFHKFGFDAGLEPSPELSGRQVSVGHAKFPGDIENRRVDYVRNDNARVGRQRSIADLLQNDPAIRTRARTENSDADSFHFGRHNSARSRDVEYPSTKGTISILAPIFSSTSRSSAFNVPKV